MRGRKPDSPEVQAAKGAPGKRLSQKDAAAVRAEKPKPKLAGTIQQPKWVRKSAKASRIWNDLMPLLSRLNLADQLDAFPLHRYCRYCVDWMAADAAIQGEGMFFSYKTTNDSDGKKLHPAWQARIDCERELAKIEASYAMRASDRYRILRDQAAAHGLLPLFGNHQPAQPEAESDPDDDGSMTGDDAVGKLRQFDSLPPSKLN